MNIIVGGRGCGKTYRLVQWLKENPEQRTLVVYNETAATWLRRDYNIEEPRLHSPTRVISWSSFVQGRLAGMPHNHEVAIDNLELCLNWPIVPSIISLTGVAEILQVNKVTQK